MMLKFIWTISILSYFLPLTSFSIKISKFLKLRQDVANFIALAVIQISKKRALANRILFAIALTMIARLGDYQYELFFVLSLPQIFRNTLEKIGDTMSMRQFRIFVGPASIGLQFLMLQTYLAPIKIVAVLIGLLNVPVKDDPDKYKKLKQNHGKAMKILFAATCFEYLLRFWAKIDDRL